MRITYFLLFLTFFTCNLSKESIFSAIMEKTTKEQGTEFDVSEYTKFHWDKLIIRSGYMPYWEVSENLGIQYNSDFPEDTYRLIFFKDNAIVHEEDFYRDSFSGPVFHFDRENPKGEKDLIYSKTEAKFIVEKVRYDKCERCFEYNLNSGTEKKK